MVGFLAMVKSPRNRSSMKKHSSSAVSVPENSIKSTHSPYTIYNLLQNYPNTQVHLIAI